MIRSCPQFRILYFKWRWRRHRSVTGVCALAYPRCWTRENRTLEGCPRGRMCRVLGHSFRVRSFGGTNRGYSLCSHPRLLSGDAFSVYSTLGQLLYYCLNLNMVCNEYVLTFFCLKSVCALHEQTYFLWILWILCAIKICSYVLLSKICVRTPWAILFSVNFVDSVCDKNMSLCSSV